MRNSRPWFSGRYRQNSRSLHDKKSWLRPAFFLAGAVEIAPDAGSRLGVQRGAIQARLYPTSRQSTGGVALSRLRVTGEGMLENHS
jgi:hypothetical protein